MLVLAAMTQEVLKIAIAGLGNVGASAASLLLKNRALYAQRAGRALALISVSARDAKKDRGVDLSGVAFETDPLALASGDADIVVELIGGAEGAARALVEAALANGKHVVTANKALIATHGAALAKLAEENNVSLCFEAAVAGGIPILKTLREGLAANRIDGVSGILNGTCNYILTGMWEEKREFADMLAEAQTLGYAEADPTFDIGGIDAAHKLAILASLAYGCAPDLASLSIEGITGISLLDMQFADELGYAIRLLGIASHSSDGLLQRVHPCLLPKESPLAQTTGVFNAVQVEASSAGSIFLHGRGAGGEPTASAVIADIIDIARGQRSYAFGVPASSLAASNPASMDSLQCAYYVRLEVIDKPGVLADITAIFRDCGISFKSLIQHGDNPGERVQLILTTHVTSERSLKNALAKIAKEASVLETPFSIRIEE